MYKHTSFSFQSSIEGFLMTTTQDQDTHENLICTFFIYETFYKGPCTSSDLDG